MDEPASRTLFPVVKATGVESGLVHLLYHVRQSFNLHRITQTQKIRRHPYLKGETDPQYNTDTEDTHTAIPPVGNRPTGQHS
jgi:hypothetical protein